MSMDNVLKLRELRRLRGLSQEEVALSSGVHVKTLSSFETGARVDSMKVVQLLAILAVYDVTPAEFFNGGVETAIFAEMERLNSEEMRLVAALRRVPEASRARLAAKFLAMIDGAAAASEPQLRAVV